ncbi:MAG: enoyl-CoA hydratase/isomerase family protein [Myxococcota bacterium]|nr:enoyl-CoA hydratase/isomerase family protein [Myxococcota bacterium]
MRPEKREGLPVQPQGLPDQRQGLPDQREGLPDQRERLPAQREGLPGLRFEVRDAIARITLARPERGNALTPAMHGAMRSIWTAVREDASIRVAVIDAAGDRHFCTGFDVAEAHAEDAEEVFANRPLDEAVFWSPHQNRVWKPVICVVTGLCVGGGHHFVVDADVVVASQNAAFMDTHVNVGMVGALENVGLARRLPLGAALRMTLLGSRYRMPARRAYELGLVDELLETPDEARACALEMAAAMAEHSPQAMALSKQAVWGSQERGYREALEAAWALLRLHWSHPDFEEGPRAFAEKRAPRWNPDPNARTAPTARTARPGESDEGGER